MRRPIRVRLTLFLAVMSWLVVVPSAQAYIDPASGSMIFQALIAGIAAAGTGLALFWHRITSLFRRSASDTGVGDAHAADRTGDAAGADRSSEQV